MIKFENIYTAGFEAAIRGMRNPMNSWDKSDSKFAKMTNKFGVYFGDINNNQETKSWDNFESLPHYGSFEIGNNDLNLMKRLVSGGPVHAKFRRMITVWLDITAPLYWWKEFDTYKVGTVANSCSTMHKIHAKEFTLDDFSCEHLINIDSYPQTVKEAYEAGAYEAEHAFDPYGLTPEEINGWVEYQDATDLMNTIIEALNVYRKKYLETKDKRYWWQMIQLLPTSYNQKRTVMLNYEVLANIYKWRKDHKLDEWRDLCKMVENLPYAKELIIGENINE